MFRQKSYAASVYAVSRRHATVPIAVLFALAGVRAVSAETFIWQPDNPATPFWLLPANWQGSNAPVSGIDTRIQFGQSASESFSTNNMGAVTLNAFDIGSTFSPNTLTVLSGTLNFITNSSSVLPTLTQNNTKNVSITSNFTLANTLTIAGGGSGALTLGGLISGNGGLVINRAVTLTQSNTYTGGTTLNSDFALATNNALTAGGNVTVVGNRFALNSFQQTVGDMTFGNGENGSGGSVLGGTSNTTGTGTLTLNGNIYYNGRSNFLGDKVFFRNDVNLILASGNHTIGLAGPPSVNAFQTEFRFENVISGSGGITVDGNVANISPNEVEFANVNTYTGATNITGGASLYLGLAQSLTNTNSSITVEAGSNLFTQSKAPGSPFFDQTLGSLSGGGTVTFGTANLTIGSNNSDTTFAGVLNGTTGSLTKVGEGTLTLSGTASYTGGTTIRGGTLRLAADNILPANGNLRVAGGTLDSGNFHQTVNDITFFGGANNGANLPVTITGTVPLTVNGNILLDRALSALTAPTAIVDTQIVLGAGNHTITHNALVLPESNYEIVFRGGISGDGGLTFTSTADSDAFTAALTTQNSYTGATTISGKTVVFLGAENALPAGSAVILAGGGLSLQPTQTSDGVVAGNYNQSIGSLAGNGGVDLGSATLTTGNDNTNTTFNGALSGNAGSLTKVGSGVFTMTGNSYFYTGATTVSGGTLVLNGDLSTSSGVTVESGGTLAGTGILPGITLNAGGTISPGNSPGTLSATSLLWNGGGILRFEQGDLLVLSGALTKGTSGLYQFDFSTAGLNTSSALDLISFDTTDFLASDFSFIGAPNGVGGEFTINNGFVHFQAGVATVVPESNSLALLIPVIFGFAGLRLKRRILA